MVTGNDHERLQNNLLVLALFHFSDNIFQARLRLYGTYIVMLITLRSKHILHFCVNSIGISLSTVTHEADCGLTVIILSGSLRNCLDHCLEIIITG